MKCTAYIIFICLFIETIVASEKEIKIEKKALLFFHGGGGMFGSVEDNKNIEFTNKLIDKYDPIIIVDYKLFWKREHRSLNQKLINEYLSALPPNKKYDVIAVSAGAYVFKNAEENLIKPPSHFYGISPMLSSEGGIILNLIGILDRLTSPKTKCHQNLSMESFSNSFPVTIFHGENDRIIDSQQLLRSCAHESCHLIEIENAHHFLLDSPIISKTIKKNE